MDPNLLREKFLKSEKLQIREYKLPEKILDISPISLACMKYQNNAINFIIKYNGTIREIKSIQKQIFKSQIVQNDLQQYY
jgi:hypothetical protein